MSQCCIKLCTFGLFVCFDALLDVNLGSCIYNDILRVSVGMPLFLLLLLQASLVWLGLTSVQSLWLRLLNLLRLPCKLEKNFFITIENVFF